MSIPGTGVQNNPYIVSTWDDLVTYCAESNAYVKLGANIDTMNEYPDGDIPQLRIVCAQLDGDGKTINNIYSTGNSGSCVYINSTAKLINTNFTNINSSKIFIGCEFSNSMPIENCKFAGVTSTYFVEAEHMRGCSFNVNTGSYPAWHYYDNAIIQDCRFKIKTTNSYLFTNTRATYSYCSLYNCYIEADAANYTGLESQASKTRYDNCVFDITTDHVATLDASNTSGGYSPSIVNQTHAPNLTASNMIVAVTDSNWLNVSALQAVGFKIY